MLDIEVVESALLFLARTTLRGDEVPAFVNVTNALHEQRQILLLQAGQQPVSRAREARKAKKATPSQ